jgi:hypothetical protein
MAARFQGLAVRILLEKGSDAAEVNSALGALATYLDFLENDVPTRRLSLSTDSGLLSFHTASLSTAQELSDRAARQNLQGRLQEAIDWATRTMRYCDLFAAQDNKFASLSTENLRRIVAWSATGVVQEGLASLARLRGVLGSGHPDAQYGAGTRPKAAIAAEPSAPDRRLWCCSVRDLLLLVADLERAGISSSDVHTLAAGVAAISGIDH